LSTQISGVQIPLLSMLCSGFFATNRPYVRLWSELPGQADGRTRCVSGRPARQRRTDHAGSNCSVAEFGDLRANSRCILKARPAPALSGARHRSVTGGMETDFADDDFLVACHHDRWIGARLEALSSRRTPSTSSAPLSSIRLTLLFAAPSLSELREVWREWLVCPLSEAEQAAKRSMIA